MTPREAGEAAFYECEGNNAACLKAAFDAYEAAEQTPRVRLLEWQDRYQTNADGESEVIGWLATTGFGAPYRVWVDDFNVNGWQLSYGAVIGNFGSPEDAMAAGQSHFAKAVLSGLIDPVPPATSWEERARFYERDAAAAWDKCEEYRKENNRLLLLEASRDASPSKAKEA